MVQFQSQHVEFWTSPRLTDLFAPDDGREGFQRDARSDDGLEDEFGDLVEPDGTELLRLGDLAVVFPRRRRGGAKDATPGAEGKVLGCEAAEGRDGEAVDPPRGEEAGGRRCGRRGEAGPVRCVEFVDEGEVGCAVGDLECEDLAEGDEQVGVQFRVVAG